MAINDSIVIMLRALINDLDSATYTDARLDQLLAVSAMYVNQDLSRSYTVDVATPDISPDPLATSSQDLPFVNLLVIKAACLVDQGTLRVKAAMAGLEAKCGPSISMKVVDSNSILKDLLTVGPCGAYQITLQNYLLGSGDLYHAVLSPFVSNDFDPYCWGYEYSLREDRIQ